MNMSRNSLIPNVKWYKYLSVSNYHLNEYLELYGDEFLLNIFNITIDAIDTQKPIIVLISFIDSDIVSTVERKEYQLVLQKLLNVCEHLEKYEICQLIVDYKNKNSNLQITKSHIPVKVTMNE